jgi:hypothetical protein
MGTPHLDEGYLLTSAVLNTFETPAPDQQADITKKE